MSKTTVNRNTANYALHLSDDGSAWVLYASGILDRPSPVAASCVNVNNPDRNFQPPTGKNDKRFIQLTMRDWYGSGGTRIFYFGPEWA